MDIEKGDDDNDEVALHCEKGTFTVPLSQGQRSALSFHCDRVAREIREM